MAASWVTVLAEVANESSERLSETAQTLVDNGHPIDALRERTHIAHARKVEEFLREFFWQVCLIRFRLNKHRRSRIRDEAVTPIN